MAEADLATLVQSGPTWTFEAEGFTMSLTRRGTYFHLELTPCACGARPDQAGVFFLYCGRCGRPSGGRLSLPPGQVNQPVLQALLEEAGTMGRLDPLTATVLACELAERVDHIVAQAEIPA